MALSNASGPSSMPPLICPRSAILQSAAASSVAGIFEFTVSTAARIATFGRSTPNVRARSIAFWQMSTLSSSVGAMLIARVGHDQDLVVRGHVHQEHMAQPPARAESRLPGDDRAQQFIRVQAALHQQLGLALADQFHRLGRRGVAVGHVHDLRAAEVDALRLGDLGDRRGRSDQDGHDQALGAGVDRAGQRRFLAGIGDRRRDRRQAAAPLEQLFVLAGSRMSHA